MKKKFLGLVLSAAMLVSMVPAMAFAAETAPTSIDVYVTLSNKGTIVTGADTAKTTLANTCVTVTDQNKSGTFDVDDVLYAVHEAYYDGGAEKGYKAETTSYGLSLKTLWGDTSGSVGYYVNNSAANSLADPVAAGDYVAAYVYADGTTYTDEYSYFNTTTATVQAGKPLQLTVTGVTFDKDFNTVLVPVDTMTVTADGTETAFKTNDSGVATLTFDKAGTYVVSGKPATGYLVPPVCVVTVTEAPAAPVEVLPFTDVAAADWFYDAVKYSYDNKLFGGVTDTTFAPNADMTREMLVTVLYRMEGEPAVADSVTTKFTDVASDKYYTKAVLWATANEIVKGLNETTFGTGANISREQIATILLRYAQYKKYDTTAVDDLKTFTDAASVSGWSADAMKWAVGAKIITGVQDTLVPQGNATRAQVATMLMRFAQTVAK